MFMDFWLLDETIGMNSIKHVRKRMKKCKKYQLITD